MACKKVNNRTVCSGKRASWWLDFLYGTDGDNPETTDLTFASQIDRTWASPEWEMQDRVQCNRIESNILYCPWSNRVFNSGFTKMWDTKFRSKGGIYYYDIDHGHYDAIIDMGKYAGEVDYHNARVCIYTCEEGVYLKQEDRHGGDIYMYFSDHTLGKFTLIQTLPAESSMARGEPYRLGVGEHLWIAQKKVGLGDVSTFAIWKWNSGLQQYDTPIDIVVKQSTGKRVYAFKPWGYSGADNDGWYRMILSNSSSEAHYEYFELKTRDWNIFYNAFETSSFNVAVGGAVDTIFLRNNGFRIVGEDNSPYNLGDHTEAITADGRLHMLFYEDYRNKMYYITRNATQYIQTEIDFGYVVSGYYDRGSTYALATSTTSLAVPVGSGNAVNLTVGTGITRLVEIAADLGRIKLVSASNPTSIIYIFEIVYNPATGALSGTTFGAQGTAGTHADWTLYTSGLRDGVSCQFLFERGDYLYAGLRVVLPSNYRRVYMFRSPANSPDTGIVWEFVKDTAEGIPNIDVHKVGTPENINEIPDNTNFPIYSCKFAYTNTNNGQPGTNYSLISSFGTINPVTPDVNDSVAYANVAAEQADIVWGAGYSVDNLNQSSGSITQANDVTGNGNHAVAVGSAIHLNNGAIKTYGSSYFSIPNYATFTANTAFSFATVARKVNDCWMLSFGDVANTYNYLGLKMVLGHALQHYVQLTNAASNSIVGRGQLVGIDYAIIFAISDGLNMRIYVNGVEVNKIWSTNAPATAIMWANQYNTGLDNMLIGARITTTSEFTSVDFKEWRYKNATISYAQRRKLEKTWADKYGITLRSFGTATTYEPEAELAFDRMSPEPSSTEKGNLSALIQAIKTSQNLTLGELCLGNLFDTLYIRATDNANNALINYGRERFDTTLVNAPVFTNNRGYKSNGSSSYLNWTFKPSRHSSFPNNAFQGFAYVVEDMTGGNKAAMGLRQSTPSTITNFRLAPKTAANASSGNVAATTGVTIASITDARGYISGEKTGGTTTTIRKDLATNTGTSAAQAMIDRDVYELAVNVNDTTPEWFLDATVAISGWGSYLIDDVALRTALRNWLINTKGVSGI